jgi:hypothetical protein
LFLLRAYARACTWIARAVHEQQAARFQLPVGVPFPDCKAAEIRRAGRLSKTRIAGVIRSFEDGNALDFLIDAGENLSNCGRSKGRALERQQM